MACPTGPEAVVEDFGTAKLQSGQAHVELDPLFLDAVTIEEEHPMNVQVQLNGDCAGVYVVKGTSGFDVIELGGGRSSVAFDYRVVATRRGSTGRWTRPTVASGSLEEKASR